MKIIQHAISLSGDFVSYFDGYFWILIGLIAGSFVNTCIDRLPLQFANKELRLRLLKSSKLSPHLKNS